MAFGVADTKSIDLAPGIDTAFVQGLTTRSGLSFVQILRDLDARAAAFNGSVSPLEAALIRVTTELLVDSTGVQPYEINPKGEYTLARPQIVEGAAYPLPYQQFDVSLGFTEDGIETATRERLNLMTESLFEGFRMRRRKDVLRRLFSDAEVRIDPRTTMTSPGFAGSGTGFNVFTQPYPDGTALPGGYTHYYFANTSTGGAFRTALRNAVDRLKKWHTPPFDLITTQATLDLIIALGAPDFVSAGTILVRQGTGTAEAMLDPNEYVGALFGEVRVRPAITDTTSPNVAIFKSFGALAPSNPLAYRYDPLKGRDAIIRSRSLYPLDQATAILGYGIGVNNRTAVALIHPAAGAAAYVAPTDL